MKPPKLLYYLCFSCIVVVFTLVCITTPLSFNDAAEPAHKFSDVAYNWQSISESVEPNEQDTSSFAIRYSQAPSADGQYRFQTSELSEAQVMLFTHKEGRAQKRIKSLAGVFGTAQFFLDVDPLSGYIHQYTTNFFNRCPKDGFVLKLERSTSITNKATIHYVHKEKLMPNDKLGLNVVAGRQWKLSELKLHGDSIEMVSGSCTSSPGFVPASTSILYACPPLRTVQLKSPGIYPISKLDAFSRNDGGTVALVWEHPTEGIRFIDIHGSIKDILETAIKVRETYHVDPTILIHDAGPMARKIKSDTNGILDFAEVNKVTGLPGKVGAGYAYLIEQ
ncbi:MAG: hypothetical protein RL090_702 [Bacteroidota bacterium]